MSGAGPKPVQDTILGLPLSLDWGAGSLLWWRTTDEAFKAELAAEGQLPPNGGGERDTNGSSGRTRKAVERGVGEQRLV
jgi:hypothetical protein